MKNVNGGEVPKEVGAGITNNFWGTVNGMQQMQQGNDQAQQNQTIGQESFDYEAVKKIVEEINKKRSALSEEYGDKTEEVYRIVSEIKSLVDQKKEPNRIKKALQTLRELSMNVTGEVIATGITALISNLPL